MARKETAHELVPYPGRITVRGRYTRNGAGAIDQTTIHGHGITSVTRDAAGADTILFDAKYAGYEYASCKINAGAAKADVDCQCGTVTVAPATTNATMLIWSYVPTTNGASDHSLEVSFEVTFMQLNLD